MNKGLVRPPELEEFVDLKERVEGKPIDETTAALVVQKDDWDEALEWVRNKKAYKKTASALQSASQNEWVQKIISPIRKQRDKWRDTRNSIHDTLETSQHPTVMVRFDFFQ
jgi:hypothetical protein